MESIELQYKRYIDIYKYKTSHIKENNIILYEEIQNFFILKLKSGVFDKRINESTNGFIRITIKLVEHLKKDIFEYEKEELEVIARELKDYSLIKSFFNYYYKKNKDLFLYDFTKPKKVEITENIYTHFEEQTIECRKINFQLFNHMKLYFYEKFSTSKSKRLRSEVNKSIRVTNFLIKNIHKKIEEYTNEEIKQLSENITKSDRSLLMSFLEYYSTKINLNCKYGYDNNLVSDINGYVTYEEAAKILGVSKSTVRSYVTNKKIQNKKMYKRKLYISKDEILKLKNKEKSGYMSTVEASELLNVTPQHVLLLCKQNKFPNATIENNTRRWNIPIEDVELFKKNNKSMRYAPNDISGQFDYLTDAQSYKYTDLHIKFRKFAISTITTSGANDKTTMIRQYTNTFNRLVEAIYKDLYLYTNEELIDLIGKKIFTGKDEPILTNFFKYYKTKNKKCKYNSVITPKRIKSDKNKNTLKNIYSKEEWTKYYLYLIDIDLHFQSAIEDPKYASIWIYTILHLIIGWRAGDFRKLPNVALEVVEIYEFEWFIKNEFTLSMAESLISQYKVDCMTITTNKTKANAHFVVPLDMIIPVSIALIIGEIHRRNNNEDILLYKFRKQLPNTKDFIKFFKDEKLKKFSSIKANRSLLTHSFNFATRKNGDAMLAYSYSTYLRSHKINSKKHVSNITSQYIYSTNDDGSLDDVTYNLFRRGHFGWLYHKIVEVAYGNYNNLLMNEATDIIVNMQSNIKHSELEVLSGFLLSRHEEKKDIIRELLEVDKDILKEKISKLIKGDMPSKMEHAQCFVSGKCIYPLSSTCLGCKYILPMNYILIALNEEIIKVSTTLANIEEYKEFERIKYTELLRKLLNLLNDFKKEYLEYDKNFMMKYIDFKVLQRNIQKAREKYLGLE